MPEADWEPSPLYASWPGCRKCRHFRGTHFAVYPVRIPLPIVSGQVDHMVPRPGDHGILFEPISVEQPAKAAS